MRRIAAVFSLAALILGGAQEPSRAQAIGTPASLNAYIGKDGRLSETDYSWLRWKFSSDPADKARWSELMVWAARTHENNQKEMQARVRGLGLDASKVDRSCGSNEVCDGVLLSGFVSALPTWEATQAAIAEAQPLASAYALAVGVMEQQALVDASGDLPRELMARRAGEQALRSALTDSAATPAGLSASGNKAWRMLIWRETSHRDLANTAWLKGVVAERGWPKRSQVGKEAASAAWLLVQHADRDPAFQITALRLMEPMVARNEVEPKDYAFLHDRVIGSLSGRQRYGTQMVCSSGRFVPQEIDDERNLAQRRKAVGLPPIAEQLKRFAARTC